MTRLFNQVREKFLSLRRGNLDSFIFIHINKTGGSSVEKALEIPFDHRTALERMRKMGRKKWNKKFTFTVVRNPWDKVVSHYHYRVDTNQTNLGDNPIGFNEWVRLTYGKQDPQYYNNPQMFMPQIDWISDETGEVLVDEIIRFENLDEEFNVILKKLGRKALLPHVKKSKRGSYRDYYEPDTIEIVRNWFARDIEIFGYQF